MMNYKSRFNVSSYAGGGSIVPQGPSHEDGGMAVVDTQTGEQTAEIEGGERIFSVDDTKAIEEMAMDILSLQDQGDEQKATELATQLGMSIVAMLAQQDESQTEQELGEGRSPISQNDSMDYMEVPDDVPMGKKGMKFKRY